MDWYYTLLTISGIFVITQICVDFVVKHVFKDGRTNRHRLFRRILLGLSIVAVLMTVTTTAVLQRKREASAQTDRHLFNLKLNELRSDQTNLNNTIEQQSETIRTLKHTVDHQSKTIESLNLILATNKAVEFSTRSALLEARKKIETLEPNSIDLSAAVSEWRTREAIAINKSVEKQRTEAETAKIVLPVFNDAASILKNLLREMAKDRNGKVTMASDYEDWPVGKAEKVHYATISTGTNNAWQFEIQFDNVKSYGYPGGPCPPYLHITNKGITSKTLLRINAESGKIHYYFETLDDSPVNLLLEPNSDLKTPLASFIRQMIAEQAAKFADAK